MGTVIKFDEYKSNLKKKQAIAKKLDINDKKLNSQVGKMKQWEENELKNFVENITSNSPLMEDFKEGFKEGIFVLDKLK